MTSVRDSLPHELVHAHLSPLGVPRWLDEGVAQRLTRRVAKRPRLMAGGIVRKELLGYWKQCGLTTFWSGAAFGSIASKRQREMAYLLSEILTNQMAEQEILQFRSFLRDAKLSDGGNDASIRHFGFGLGTWIQRVLGNGPWDAQVDSNATT